MVTSIAGDTAEYGLEIWEKGATGGSLEGIDRTTLLVCLTYFLGPHDPALEFTEFRTCALGIRIWVFGMTV